MTWRHLSSGWLAMCSGAFMPAALTRMSMGPSAALASSKKVRTDSSERTSSARAKARTPAASIAACVASSSSSPGR